jgi:hypothetical protein
MKLGLFMMPLHDPQRDYTQVLQEDRGAILLAEQLGYEKASRHRPDPPQDQPGGQEELNAGGRRVYKVEMLLHPVAAGSPFFDGAIIDRLLAQCPEPDEIEAGFHIWKPYDPSLRYAIGAVQLKATAAITALPFCSTLVLFLIASRFVCKQSHPRRPVRARAEPLGGYVRDLPHRPREEQRERRLLPRLPKDDLPRRLDLPPGAD